MLRFFRLSTAITILGLCVTPTRAEVVEQQFEYAFQDYRDNNLVSVGTHALRAGFNLGTHTGINAHYLVDGISGASRNDIHGSYPDADGISAASQKSLDGITSASPTNELRHQLGASVSVVGDVLKRLREKLSDNPTTASIGAIVSQENDYHSNTMLVSVAQDLLHRNTTLGLSYSLSLDQFTPPSRYIPLNDAGWERYGDGKRRTERGALSLTHGLSLKTLARASIEYGRDQGYLARPYYLQKIGTTYYKETLPPRRDNIVLALKLNHYLSAGQGIALRGGYRFYDDTWDITSHTADIELRVRLGTMLTLAPSYRFYHQSGAFFFAEKLQSVPTYLTADLKYGPHNTHTLGMQCTIGRDVVAEQIEPRFALVPAGLDIGFWMMHRGSTEDVTVRNGFYNYWPTRDGFWAGWLRTSVRLAF